MQGYTKSGVLAAWHLCGEDAAFTILPPGRVTVALSFHAELGGLGSDNGQA